MFSPLKRSFVESRLLACTSLYLEVRNLILIMTFKGEDNASWLQRNEKILETI